MSKIVALVIMLLASVISSCAHQYSKRAAYNALQQRQCIKDTGNPNCDPEHMTYEEYKEQRDKLNKQ